ncbi:MAG: histidinol dehydrogenase [Planctomycetota bacterium]
MNQITTSLIRRLDVDGVRRAVRPPVDDQTLDAARTIVNAVRQDGMPAVRRFAAQFGERRSDEAIVYGRDAMQAARDALGADDCAVLERAATRIKTFAIAQRAAIQSLSMNVPGGQAGHDVVPVTAAGCYAPAGRYPLPSSVLMTAMTARAAGCERVVVASPGANPVMLAAASIAGADEFIAVGGAHAIAMLAYGTDEFDRVDVIAGPGNRWVTAAKQLVSGIVGIDMLAGPSELLVIADETASADVVAADLLAQAEHDVDAVPMLITTSSDLANEVDAALVDQLESLPTADVATAALGNGFICVVRDEDSMVALADQVAAEHLEVQTRTADSTARRIRNAGALFIGTDTAEVLGDYGAGPNHTLPTGGSARFQAGLSVMHFLRLRTWISMSDPPAARELIADTERIARMEGLEGHARSAGRRAVR